VQYASPVGNSFTHNYQIYLTPQSDDVMYLTDNSLSSINLGVFTGSALYVPILKGTLQLDASGSYEIRYDNGKIYHFGANNKIASIEDSFGNSLTFTYDSVGRLTQTTDTLGRTFTYAYDATEHLSRVTDSTGRYAQFTYYAASDTDGLTGDLKNILLHYGDSSEKQISFTYETGSGHEHNMLTLTDSKGQIYVTNSYDTNDRVVSQVYGTGTITYDYSIGDLHIDDTGSLAGTGDVTGHFVRQNEVHDKAGNKTTYTYDRLGNMLSQEVFTST